MPIKIVKLTPEDYALPDAFHLPRWMCKNCGLIFDYQFDEEGPGWPKFDPPLYASNSWMDENGDYQEEEIDHKESCPRCEMDFENSPPIRIRVSQMKALSDLDDLIQQGEGISLDFKEDFPKDANELRKLIVAFANTKGGSILLGVDDRGNVIGLKGIDTPEGKDNLQKRIRGLLGTIQPKTEIQIDFFSDDQGLNVTAITIPKGPMSLYTIDGTVYIRHLDEVRAATSEEIVQLVLKQQRRRNRR